MSDLLPLGIDTRPQEFKMTIQGGMLESLGINMYTTLGKCLVEFVANAYDGDAQEVEITIPFDEIETARTAVKEAAKKEVEDGKRDPFTLLLETLPDDVVVEIRDKGHGMSPEDIEKKFLPLNRHRRKDDSGEESHLMTESGRRYVMGRKGLGKLAGFGAADRVTVTTKREGQTFATEFTMNYKELQASEDIQSVKLVPKYIEGQPPEEHWTSIKLSALKCDAVRFGRDKIATTLEDNFYGIKPEDFRITLNGDTVVAPVPDYEFSWPHVRPNGDMASMELDCGEFGKINFYYVVRFRKRGDNLPAARRGVRIYCNHRLAAGPTLLSLPTGMHGFHNISYMEATVIADEIDRRLVDFINTNRTQLREDNEVISKFIETVTDLMVKAVAAHAGYRDSVAQAEIEESEIGKTVLRFVNRVPSKVRKPTQQLLRQLAAHSGVESELFKQIAPLVVSTMNAGEVLVKLAELGADPTTIESVADSLRELAEIEATDALKIYRARRDGIVALEKLTDRGEELWRRQGIENELHALLAGSPWLIDMVFENYLTSNQSFDTLLNAMAKTLKVHMFGKTEDPDRPDLVFLMLDHENNPGEVVVVELKSPTIPLDIDHLQQLKSYMRRAVEYVKQQLDIDVVAKGYLIGARASGKTIPEKCKELQYEMDHTPNATWKVLGVREIIRLAKLQNADAIRATESEEDEEENGGDQVAIPA